MNVEQQTAMTPRHSEQQAPARAPWDVRLIAWMSRDSDKAGSGERTPKQRLIYLAVLVPTTAVNVALNGHGGAPWWYASGLLFLALVIQLVSLVRDRKRRQ